MKTVTEVSPVPGAAVRATLRAGSGPRGNGRERILDAALRAFCESSYQATSVRDIARGAGVSVPGLYHHFPSKYAVLLTLLRRVMNDLITETTAAVAKAGDDSVERFGAAIEAHVTFHTERAMESFLGNTELRSLEPKERVEIVALRDRQQAIFSGLMADGVKAGRLHVASIDGATRAIVSMCTSVASWYRPCGSLTSASVAQEYRAYALAVVCAEDGR